MTTLTTETVAPEVTVGSFFVSSWGYDQTNVDFYKVVGVTSSGKSVKVQKWSSCLTSEAGRPSESIVPGDGPSTWIDWSGVDQGADYWTQQEQKVERDAPVKTKRLDTRFGRVAITLNSYSSAHLWDGAPEYQTGQGWGH